MEGEGKNPLIFYWLQTPPQGEGEGAVVETEASSTQVVAAWMEMLTWEAEKAG